MREEKEGRLQEGDKIYFLPCLEHVEHSEEMELSHALHKAEQGSDNAKALNDQINLGSCWAQYKEDV